MKKARTKTEDVDRKIYLAFIGLLSSKEKITPLRVAKIAKIEPKSLYNRIYNYKKRLGDFKNG